MVEGWAPTRSEAGALSDAASKESAPSSGAPLGHARERLFTPRSIPSGGARAAFGARGPSAHGRRNARRALACTGPLATGEARCYASA